MCDHVIWASDWSKFSCFESSSCTINEHQIWAENGLKNLRSDADARVLNVQKIGLHAFSVEGSSVHFSLIYIAQYHDASERVEESKESLETSEWAEPTNMATTV